MIKAITFGFKNFYKLGKCVDRATYWKWMGFYGLSLLLPWPSLQFDYRELSLLATATVLWVVEITLTLQTICLTVLRIRDAGFKPAWLLIWLSLPIWPLAGLYAWQYFGLPQTGWNYGLAGLFPGFWFGVIALSLLTFIFTVQPSSKLRLQQTDNI